MDNNGYSLEPSSSDSPRVQGAEPVWAQLFPLSLRRSLLSEQHCLEQSWALGPEAVPVVPRPTAPAPSLQPLRHFCSLFHLAFASMAGVHHSL